MGARTTLQMTWPARDEAVWCERLPASGVGPAQPQSGGGGADAAKRLEAGELSWTPHAECRGGAAAEHGAARIAAVWSSSSAIACQRQRLTAPQRCTWPSLGAPARHPAVLLGRPGQLGVLRHATQRQLGSMRRRQHLISPTPRGAERRRGCARTAAGVRGRVTQRLACQRAASHVTAHGRRLVPCLALGSSSCSQPHLLPSSVSASTARIALGQGVHRQSGLWCA